MPAVFNCELDFTWDKNVHTYFHENNLVPVDRESLQATFYDLQ